MLINRCNTRKKIIRNRCAVILPVRLLWLIGGLLYWDVQVQAAPLFIRTSLPGSSNIGQHTDTDSTADSDPAPHNNSTSLSPEALQGKTITTIKITGIENEKQRNNAHVFLGLEKVKDEKIEHPNYILYLIENGKKEIAQSQQPFGFYNAAVTETHHADGDNLTVVYHVTLNKPVHLNKVSVELTGAAKDDPPFDQLIADNPLRPGEVLDQQMYEKYKARFTTLAAARGYFDAQFRRSVILVNPETDKADIELLFAGNDRFHFGKVTFSESPLDEDLLQRFVRFKQGQPYLSGEVAALQQDLQGSGYFKQVLVGNEPDTKTKAVPITAQLTMNKNKHYLLGLGYSTDEGARARFNFDWRWVNSRGHTFNSKTFVSQKKYSLDNIYRIPGENPTTDYYYFRLGALHENDIYKTTKAFAEGGYHFIDGHWEHRYALVSAWENFSIGNDQTHTLLTYPQGQWVYSSNLDRINPEYGYQVGIGLRGGMKDVLSDISFAQTDLQLRTIYPLNAKNSLIGRIDLGATWTDEFHRLPPSLRYFAGGDRSIRGYRYKQIGPRDSSGSNIGGKYLATGSIEYSYSFLPDWAAAVFVDAGDAFTRKFDTKVGAGVGIRWHSPVGPIAVDIAHGFNKPNDDAFRLHINIGTELDL